MSTCFEYFLLNYNEKNSTRLFKQIFSYLYYRYQEHPVKFSDRSNKLLAVIVSAGRTKTRIIIKKKCPMSFSYWLLLSVMEFIDARRHRSVLLVFRQLSPLPDSYYLSTTMAVQFFFFHFGKVSSAAFADK